MLQPSKLCPMLKEDAGIFNKTQPTEPGHLTTESVGGGINLAYPRSLPPGMQRRPASIPSEGSQANWAMKACLTSLQALEHGIITSESLWSDEKVLCRK